jgi:hypothetical protein
MGEFQKHYELSKDIIPFSNAFSSSYGSSFFDRFWKGSGKEKRTFIKLKKMV